MERKKRSKGRGWESCYVKKIYGTFGVEMRAYGQKLVKFCTHTHTRLSYSSIDGATEDEHDKNLHQLMNVAMRNGLVFNSSKCLIKERSVSFFGLIYVIDGIKPDPDRIRDLQDIPPPRDKKEPQQFLGLMTFLSPFIRNLSEKASMLRDLLKEDSMFMWELHHQRCFDGLKHLVTTRSCLQYFNVAKTPILQTDASLLGLDAA